MSIPIQTKGVPPPPDGHDADEAVVHAILELTSPGSEARVRELVDAGLAETRPARSISFGRVLGRRALWPTAIAASLLLAFAGAFLLVPQRAGANAIVQLNRAVAALSATRDRVYDFTMSPQEPSGKIVTSISGTITARGRMFRVEFIGPFGGTVRMGFDGTTYWVQPPAPPLGPNRSASPPVFTGDGRIFERILRVRADEADALCIQTALERLRDGFDLRVAPSTDANNPGLLLVANRTTAPALRADHVEALIDPDTGLVRSVKQHWTEPARDLMVTWREDVDLDVKAYAPPKSPP
jgi:hypothetical protein